MAALKYSRQREAIKNFLANRCDHPTADTIYACLREEYPNISLGTVYRNLSLLTDLGEISRISTGGGAEHYDGDLSQHQHFICTHCQKIFDLPIENMDSIMETASENFSEGRIETYRAIFYGTCRECQKDTHTREEI